MDGRGGCCLVRYAGDADVASKVERIMLRYRPIAPKPASPRGSPPSDSPVTESMGELKVGGARTRRRRRREGLGRRGRKRRAPYAEEAVAKKRVVAPPAGDLVTLQLMPETPVAAAAAAPPADLALSCPLAWGGLHVAGGLGADVSALVLAPASWVTLECVTEVVGEGRCTWAEARAALDGDACPGFLSDVSDRVAWTNAAYRRMVGAGEAGEAAAALATWGRVPGGAACGGFACRVRVRCARRCGQKAWSLVAPCDVLRLAEDGWLAWRLDVKAALSLGR